MNLQQLNGSGKNVRYFIATAFVALIITGGSWWLTEQWNTLRAWRNRDPESYEGPITLISYAHPKPNYSILVRAAMLTWLVTHGHWSWMIQSRVGWCTLTNSISRCQNQDKRYEGSFAGDYLSKAIRPGYDLYHFKINYSRW